MHAKMSMQFRHVKHTVAVIVQRQADADSCVSFSTELAGEGCINYADLML